MRVRLLEWIDEDRNLARLDSPAGQFWGQWSGDRPEGGELIDVELEVMGELDWGRISLVSDGGDGFAAAESGMMLAGVVEELDNQGVLTLRINDGLVSVDTVGEAPVKIIGEYVQFVVPELRIYPTGV